MGSILFSFFSEMLEKACVDYAVWFVRSKVDDVGRGISEFIAAFDDDGDGVYEREESIFTFDVSIPCFTEDGFCFCSLDDKIGMGMPKLDLVDALTMVDRFADAITGNGFGYLIDDDVYIPLPFDFSGDGVNDWGRIIDDNDDGIPDASPEAPFYPIGSDEYKQIVSRSSGEMSAVIISPDGTISVYDQDCELTEQYIDEAYSLWLKDNSALDKPFKYYTVTEALLLIVAAFAGVSLIGKLFKRRRY